MPRSRWRCHGRGDLVAADHAENQLLRISVPPEIIHQAIWLYLRFTLSLRDVEDLLAERGIAISYETVRRWVNHSDRSLQRNCASAVPSRMQSGILTRSI
jgi:transposase-like protein